MVVHDTASQLGVLVGGGKTRDAATGATAFHFAIKSLDRDEVAPRRLPLDFLAHGLARSPNDPNLLLVFEKHGPGACALDLESGAVRHVLETSSGREFYGHGAFSPDGRRLYCTETDVEHGNIGYVAIRDGQTFEYLGDFPTHGLAPHDCELRDAGRTLVVANGGSATGSDEDRPCVAWVDVEGGELLRRELIPADHLNAGHLALTSAGDLVVVSAPRDGLPEHSGGGVCLRTVEGTLRWLDQPRDVTDLMVGETLSVAIHEPTRTVGVTSPEGHLVAFFDLDSGSLRRSLRIPNPRGIAVTLDQREFVVTFGGTAKACRINTDTLGPVEGPGNREGLVCGISGSHVTVLDTPLFAGSEPQPQS